MNESHSSYLPQTWAAQALSFVDPATGAIVPPIHPSTAYVRNEDNQLISGRLYSRADNPNYDFVEELVTRLEGGVAGALFASGMAAAASIFQALRPGDHVLVPEIHYWALRGWLMDWAVPWGLQIEIVDTTQPEVVAAAIRPGVTKLIWLETPANPTLAIADIEAIVEIAHRQGVKVAVDSTFASPALSQPLRFDADLVMHSATKYLNGHSDVVAGIVITNVEDEFWAEIKRVRFQSGSVLGPFEAWLLLRGIRTLFVRVQAQSRSALALAEHFHSHPGVEAVLYPGLPDFAGHAIARKQMQGGFGGMLSLRIRGGEKAALEVIRGVKLWKRATSLGGVESLIEHRSTLESSNFLVPRDLLRLSVGLEAVEDLIADLEQALAGAASSPG